MIHISESSAFGRLVRRRSAQVAFVVILLAFVCVVVKWSGRDTSDYPGSVEHPAALREYAGERLHQRDSGGLRWRSSTVSLVMEAPLAEGQQPGRCFVTFGHVFLSGFGPSVATDDAQPLNVAFAANGVVVASGDAELPCNAAAIEQAASPTAGSAGRTTLERAADYRGPKDIRYFVTVNYVLGDVEPDSVVLSTSTLQAGQGVPGDSGIYAFRLSDPRHYYEDPELDAWNGVFGFEPVVSDA